ncbi:MAG: class I SAM-dependent methyltransferase, partial [Planctomycetota bacterium]
SLLEIADARIQREGWTNVTTHNEDATRFALAPGSADVVTFSYSLTMIPDWFESIMLAQQMLRPGGVIGITDFYVSRKHPSDGHRKHGWLRSNFWRNWFATDNVYLNGDIPAMLHRRFEVQQFEERYGKVPYVPFVRAPYYLFIGRRPDTD